MLAMPSNLWSTLLLSTLSLAANIDQNPVVQVQQTRFQGLYNASAGVESFRGIHYSKTARLRRGVPITYNRKASTVNATFFGVACPQVKGQNTLAVDYGVFGTHEDCTILDIYRPQQPKGKLLPVMLFLHGGALTQGAASFYHSDLIVSESIAINLPVIAISINYRLATWGFLGGKEVSANGAQNLGLYDQRDALNWVQNYIKNFGGDPARVTVFGQSSGAMSIAWHMLNVKSNLFSAAILQSGSTTSVPALPADKYQVNYDALVDRLGCSTADNTFECVRTVDQDFLNNVTLTMFTLPDLYGLRPWGVTIDGDIVPDEPSVLLAQKKILNIPTIVGDVRDEGTIFVRPQTIANTTTYLDFLEKDFRNRNATFFQPENADAQATLLSLYPEEPTAGSPFDGGSDPFFGLQFKRAAATYGDLHFHAPRRNFLDTMVSKKLDTWSYQFETPAPNAAPWQGVLHTSDTTFLFMRIDPQDTVPINLSKQIIAYWASFAQNHNPNHPDHPAWPQYSQDHQLLKLMANNGTGVIPDTFRQEQIDFLRASAGLLLESPV